MERIPISGPWITEKEIAYVADAAANAWYANADVYHQRFERAFADYIGVSFAISLPSCTSAIHLSLLALGVGPGDEVIVPDITWIATAAPVSYVGATPVFADIDPTSWCLSCESFEECITPKTKAVIPVDLYGSMPDWDAIRAAASRHGIFIIEDAAQAIASEYKVQKAGSFGHTGVFSFHGSKTLTTGEGGMLVTNRQDIRDRVLFLRDHGRNPDDSMFFNTEVAYKYKMSGLQAALGLAQLERIEQLVARKREIFDWYRKHIQALEGLTLNAEFTIVKNIYWMVTAIVDSTLGIDKGQIIQELNKQNIDCRPFFHPLSSLPAYRQSPQAIAARRRNSIAYGISPYGFNLPSGLNLTPEKVARVCRALREILQGERAAGQLSETPGAVTLSAARCDNDSLIRA